MSKTGNVKVVNFNIDLKQLGKLIATKRNELGYSQDDLVEMVGVSKQTISSIETGNMKNGCKIDVISRIAIALDTSVDSLLGLNEAKETATLTDRQKLNIIKDFINLVKPKFELETYTTEEPFGSTVEEVEFYDVIHYKSSLHIDNEVLTAYLTAYYEIINLKVSNASDITKENVRKLLLNDFDKKMQDAVTFDKGKMILNEDDYMLIENQIEKGLPF